MLLAPRLQEAATLRLNVRREMPIELGKVSLNYGVRSRLKVDHAVNEF